MKFRVRISATARVESTQVVEADTQEEARAAVEDIDNWEVADILSDVDVHIEEEISEPDISDAYKLDDLRSLQFSLETARQNVQIARSDVEHYTEVGFCPAEVEAEASTLIDDLSEAETRLGELKGICRQKIQQIREKEDG